MISVFKRHNEEVQRVVSPDRLLVYEVGKDGWEPLCKFLGVPVPKDKPFPHLNDMDVYKKRLRYFNIAGYVMACGLFVACLPSCAHCFIFLLG